MYNYVDLYGENCLGYRWDIDRVDLSWMVMRYYTDSAPVVGNRGKLWGRARARGAGVERLKDHRRMPY